MLNVTAEAPSSHSASNADLLCAALGRGRREKPQTLKNRSAIVPTCLDVPPQRVSKGYLALADDPAKPRQHGAIRLRVQEQQRGVGLPGLQVKRV